MIITCEQCATQFQLDDSRVPAGGVRVRCSRCKHAFFIEPPAGAVSQDPVERAAQRALDAEAPPEPEASEDLGEGGTDLGADFEAAGDSADESDAAHPSYSADESDAAHPSYTAGESDASDASDSADESDWEFNAAPIAGESPGVDDAFDAQAAAREAIDDLLDSRPAPRARAASPANSSPLESASFAPDSGVEDDELGSPDSWDLLAEDSPATPSAPAPGMSFDAGAAAPLASVRAHSASIPRPTADEWIEPSEPSRLVAWIARSGHAIGWIVTAALFALIAVATLAPDFSAQSRVGLGTQHLAQLEARGIAGRWVENAAAGTLFVVSGRLVNAKAEPMPLGALTGVRLLDANGARVAGEPAAIGPVIEPRELRESNPAALQARQLQAGASLATASLAPGQSVPFEAVVVTVPAAAQRFVLEAIPLRRSASVSSASEPNASSGSAQGSAAPLAVANEPALAR